MDNGTTPNDDSKNGHKEETKIKTFVFMDLEATSLLEGRQKPRILELCFVAVHRSDLEQSLAQQGVLPRVMNKLTLCLDPGKPISFGASQITGLYNDTLENQKRLNDKTSLLMNCFLDHLAKPVCLLAHNGNGYDFPLLQAELNRIKEALPDDVLCADTLEAFRSLDGLPARHVPLTNQNTPTSTQNVYNKPPPVGIKRKSVQGGIDLVETGTKVVKHNIEQFDVTVPVTNNVQVNQAAEKVKKKLFVDDIVDGTKSYKLIKDSEKIETDQSSEQGEFDEFASSLENEDFLLALEDAENQFVTSRNGIGKTDSRIVDKKSNEKVSVIEGNENMQDRQRLCCVKAGTGYLVQDKMDIDGAQDQEPETNNDEKKVKRLSNTSRGSEQGDDVAQNETESPSTSSHQLSLPESNKTLESVSSISSTQTESSNSSTSQSSPISAALQTAPMSPPQAQSSSTVSTSSPNLQLPSQSSSSLAMSKPIPSTSSNISSSSHTSNNITPNRPTVSSSSSSNSGKRLSYKLEEIYLRKFGSKPEVVHSAEGDCITMVKISSRTPGLIGWLDEHAVPLSTIKPAF